MPDPYGASQPRKKSKLLRNMALGLAGAGALYGTRNMKYGVNTLANKGVNAIAKSNAGARVIGSIDRAQAGLGWAQQVPNRANSRFTTVRNKVAGGVQRVASGRLGHGVRNFVMRRRYA